MKQITNTHLTIIIIIGGVALTILLFIYNQLLPTSENQLVNDKAWILEKHINLIYNLNNEIVDSAYLHSISDSLYPSIDKRLKDGKQIVLFIPDNQCGDCITEEYKKLKSLPAYIRN